MLQVRDKVRGGMLQIRDKVRGGICNVVEFYLDYVKLQHVGTNFFFWITVKSYNILYVELES